MFNKLLISLSCIIFLSCQALIPQNNGGGKPKPGTNEPNYNPNPKSNSGNDSQTSNHSYSTSGDVDIRIDLSNLSAVNKNLFGYNTGNFFVDDMEKKPEVKKLISSIHPQVIRFPGGTIANYYHPHEKGNGFKEGEIMPVKALHGLYNRQARQKDNFLENFLYLYGYTGARVIYVANLETGTIDETNYVLGRLKDAGCDIVGVELGNEFFFKYYRDIFPNVESYIKVAKQYTKGIRAKFPNIKVSVVAASMWDLKSQNAWAKYMSDWNTKLGKETFYNGFIVHNYLKSTACEKKGAGDLDKIFYCGQQSLAPSFYDYMQIMHDFYYKFFPKSKKMWLTEWNVDPAFPYFGNTYTQAAMISDWMFNMIDQEIESDFLEVVCYHLLASWGHGYGVLMPNKKNFKPLNSGKDNIIANAAYFPFLYFSEIIINGKAKRASEMITFPKDIDKKLVGAQTYYNSQSKKLYVYFYNKSGRALNIKLSGVRGQSFHLKCLYGNKLYSSCGITGFVQKDMSLFSPLKVEDKDVSSTNIKPYSLGYFEIQL